MVIGFMLVSPEIVKLFADKNYWNGMKLIPMVAFSIYMVFLYSFAVNYELYHRESKWIAVGTTAAAICNIIFNRLLIPLLGMYGAAIATLGAYILLYVFHDICARCVIKGKYPYKKDFFIKNVLIVILFCIFYYLFIGQWAIRWITAAIVGSYLVYMCYKNKSIF